MRLLALQAFRAVMQNGTVTRAAARIRRTQPQVSRLVAVLEEELGFHLFARNGRRLIPTAEGQAFYLQVERILAGIDEVSRIADDIRLRREARLRILAQPFIADSILDEVLAAFSVEHPGLRYSLEIRSRGVREWAAGEHFDVGFAALPLDAPAVRTLPFATASLVAVLPCNHRLARRRTIAAKDFADEAFIALRPHTLLRSLVDGAFARLGIPLTMRGETSSGHSSCRMVARCLGVTLADPLAAATAIKDGIVVRPFVPTITITYGLVLPGGQEPPSRLALEFAETVADTARRRAPKHVQLLSLRQSAEGSVLRA
jgi:DNA-binding transcriptional LysR family regulator